MEELFNKGVAFGILYAKLTQLGDDRTRQIGLNWIKANFTYYGSFRWVCDVLGLEWQHARQLLMTWRKVDLDKLLHDFREAMRAES